VGSPAAGCGQLSLVDDVLSVRSDEAPAVSQLLAADAWDGVVDVAQAGGTRRSNRVRSEVLGRQHVWQGESNIYALAWLAGRLIRA